MDDTSSQIVVQKCNYYCKKCEYTCQEFSNWDKHTKTTHHLTNTNKHNLDDNGIQDKLCKYSCSKQSVINKTSSSWKEAWKDNCVCCKIFPSDII